MSEAPRDSRLAPSGQAAPACGTGSARPRGGYFDLDPEIFLQPRRQVLESWFELPPEQAVFLNLGRVALAWVLRQLGLRGAEVLVPEYLCAREMLPVFECEGVRPRFYPLGGGLLLDPVDLIRRAAPKVKAVLAINYFGLVDQTPALGRLREVRPDLALILDAVQDPYYLRRVPGSRQEPDFVFTSFQKAFPVPGGACVRSRGPLASGVGRPEEASGRISELWTAGALAKRAFLDGGGRVSEALFLEAFRQAESALGVEPAGFPPLARCILERLDLEAIAVRRRRNWAWLQAALEGLPALHPLVRDPGPEAVPLFLPVRAVPGRRDQLREDLREAGFFCPVHWPLEAGVLAALTPEGAALYGQGLSLLVDQRMEEADLESLARILRQAA